MPDPAARVNSGGSKNWRLRLRDNAMHDAGADYVMAGELMGDGLQEGVTTLDRQRPGGGHHGIKLGTTQISAGTPVRLDSFRLAMP